MNARSWTDNHITIDHIVPRSKGGKETLQRIKSVAVILQIKISHILLGRMVFSTGVFSNETEKTKNGWEPDPPINLFT